ncbi:hypothetical protein FBU59_004362 [Linderina macrospora]|uniref:Uncharacterized protein n=1 Tax=Linderina macrospora TaxID=4868 RepID=A0ACC1J5X2_9FUNG|nr:hypothetical protein FBU59_004362 [Linderina macrospora]
MQAAALSFFGVREAQYRESGAPMGSAKIADVWATDFAALDGIGYDAQSVTLKDKLGELDRFCRSDRDYDFLTQKEQQAVDLLRWQSLRMSIPTGDIRDADPTSMSLETTRENVLGVKEDQASTTDVDDEPLVTEV